MPVPSLRTAWQEGRTTLGLWISGATTPIGAEFLGDVGYDYVCVDLQHGLDDLASTIGLLQGLAGSSSVPIVRAEWNDPTAIGKALDAGAMGVIVPMVNSVAEAEAAVAATKYPPLGERSLGPLRVGRAWPDGDYFERANDAVACIPMIETAAALDQVEAIAAVPGVDALYVGPSDLSISMGVDWRDAEGDPRFLQAVQRVLAAADGAGIVAGIHGDHGSSPTRIGHGFRMVTCTSDVASAVRGARSALQAGRDAVAQRDG